MANELKIGDKVRITADLYPNNVPLGSIGEVVFLPNEEWSKHEVYFPQLGAVGKPMALGRMLGASRDQEGWSYRPDQLEKVES